MTTGHNGELRVCTYGTLIYSMPTVYMPKLHQGHRHWLSQLLNILINESRKGLNKIVKKKFTYIITPFTHKYKNRIHKHTVLQVSNKLIIKYYYISVNIIYNDVLES